MSDLPVLLSPQQILGNLIDGFLSRVQGVNDLNRGSVINQFFTSIAQSNFKAAAAIISMLDALSVDRATGEALQRLAADADVPISSGTYATGTVNITDTSFNKIATQIFAGQPAPVAGSLLIYVVDASLWSQTGQLYIGRGTQNVEGPLTFTSVASQAGGAYWLITLNATTPTTKFHNINEVVTEAQGGNRAISSGSLISTPTANTVTATSYKTTSNVTILDGEVTVSNVPIQSTVLGTKGNVPAGAISVASGLPFTASVTNVNPIVNGLPPDTTDTIRAKIKAAELAKSNGTAQAIQIAAVGVTSPDDLKTVQSADTVSYADGSASLIFDDGNIYEPIYHGVGLEQVIYDATGGEYEAQLRSYPVTQAAAYTDTVAPYSVPDQYGLSVTILGTTTIHYFPASAFQVPTAQQAYEIVDSINGDPNINFSAATANGDTTFYVYPRSLEYNEIQVNSLASNDANVYLGLPTTINYSLLLYKNDNLLYEDGALAQVFTANQSAWNSSIVSGDTLEYSVDGTPTITATFTDDEFQAIDPEGAVSATASLTDWAAVMNGQMSGVIATVANNQIVFTSARGESDSASLSFTGGTLLSKIFATGAVLVATGRASDYVLNKNTGQIGLAVDLVPGDDLNAGSIFTRAHVNTSAIPDGPAAPGNAWLLIDGNVQTILSGVSSAYSTTIVKSGTLMTISTLNGTVPVGYDSVQPGDWLLLWTEPTDITDYPVLFAAQGFWRVQSVQRGQIVVDDGATPRPSLVAPAAFNMPSSRIVFARSAAPMQKLSFTATSLDGFIGQIQGQLVGVEVDTIGAEVRISTLSYSSYGQIFVAASDIGAQAIDLPTYEIINNVLSQQGYGVTSDSEAGVPSFTISNITAIVDPTDVTDPNYQNYGGTRDDFMQILDRYTYSPSALTIIPDSNQTERVFVRNYNPATGDITTLPKNFMLDTPPWSNTINYSIGDYVYYLGNDYTSLTSGNIGNNPASSLVNWMLSDYGDSVTPLKLGDRYFLRTSYQFDVDDSVSVIIDGSGTNPQTYSLEVDRTVVVDSYSTPTYNTFSAEDGESSLALSSVSSFYDFDFSDFKVWRRANTLLTNGTYDILIQAASFGPMGNRTRVGFVYPTSTSETAVSVVVSNTETLDIGIVIPVSTPRTPNWDATTSFIMTTTPLWNNVATYSIGQYVRYGVYNYVSVINGNIGNVPNVSPDWTLTAKDSITYTYEVGTQPNFLGGAGGANVTVGDVAMISPAADFLPGDADIYALVTNVTATSFTVEVPFGTVVTDDLSFSSILNQGGIMLITTPTPNQIQQGQMIGIYNTEDVSGSFAPMNGTYFPTIISPTEFSVVTPSDVPGGFFTGIGAIAANYIVTVNANNHGLSVGNMIIISGAGAPFNGLWEVQEVPNANQFVYGIAVATVATSANGRYDFQSYGADPTLAPANIETNQGSWVITTTYSIGQVVVYDDFAYASLTNGNIGHNPAVTFGVNWDAAVNFPGLYRNNTAVTVFAPNSFSVGDLVQISGVTVASWGGSAFTYIAGDVVLYSGQTYINLTGVNTATTPDLDTANWATTVFDLTGKFQILSASSSEFVYAVAQNTGHTFASGGTATRLVQTGALARSLGATANLQFGAISTTSQQVASALDQNYAEIVLGTVEAPDSGSSVINMSTEDLGKAAGYLITNITSIASNEGSRLIYVTTSTNVPAGSTVTVDITTGYMTYNGTYTVLATTQLTINTWQMTLQSAYLSYNSTTYPVTGTAYGTTPYQMLQDGENSVLFSNLQATPTNPQFTTKQPWASIPAIGEEIRLLATNTDQLTRFWNELVVTGLSNVAAISNSEIGRQVEIDTYTVGSQGSVEVTGGNANAKTVALTGSGFNYENKVGVIQIPLALRPGINEKDWLLASQTVRNNKRLGFTNATNIVIANNDSLSISGGGTFQTKRTTTQDATSAFKVELHGNFVAIINVGGTDVALQAAQVQEGDWVRFLDTPETAYSNAVNYAPSNSPAYNPATSYSVGQTVSYSGSLYIAIAPTLGNTPNSSPLYWSLTSDRVNYNGSNWTAVYASGPGSTVVSPIPTTVWDADTTYPQYSTVTYKGAAWIQTSATPLSLTPPDNMDPSDPTNTWQLVWQIQEWSGGNTGVFQVVRVFGDHTFWIENSFAVEEMIYLGNQANLSFYSYDSVMPGDVLIISGSIPGFNNSNQNIGQYIVRDETFAPGYAFPSATTIFTDPIPQNTITTQPAWVNTTTYSINQTVSYGGINYVSLQNSNTGHIPSSSPLYWSVVVVNLGDAYSLINVQEENPVRLWKHVFTVGPVNSTTADIIVDSPNLIDRLSSSNAAYVTSQGKLNFPTNISVGVDAYKAYDGLIKELNRVIYGDPTDPLNYPGIRAAGADVNIMPSVSLRVTLAMSVRILTGLPFNEVLAQVQAAAAGYVNNLDTGEAVNLSQVIQAVSQVTGVESVVITYPEYDINMDQIVVSPTQKAFIVNPTTDVVVTILGT